jgi:hypothetical protein
MDPGELDILATLPRFSSVEQLHISSIRIMRKKEDITTFLYAFPNLTVLSLGFHGWGPSVPSPVGDLEWPRLNFLRLSDIWTSEQEIFTIFENHSSSLSTFTLQDSALTQGSWKSLFTRMRNISRKVEVTALGELFGRSRKDTLDFHYHPVELLTNFMHDREAPWPFETIEHH